MIVSIHPMKYTKSYTIYIQKGKYNKSGKLKWTGDWKKAGSIAADSSHAVKVVISKYGNAKLNRSDSVRYRVTAVTHTAYGNSPGSYWVVW